MGETSLIYSLRKGQLGPSFYGAGLLLLLLFAQAMLSLPLASPTFDEPYDVARGYAYARGPDLRMQQEHPVLIDGLGGLMLRLMPELTPPERIAGWDDAHLFRFSQSLLWKLGHDVDKMMFLVRFPVVCIAMLLGAIVYRWASEMVGSMGALLALALLVFNPNIVAHAKVFSTDLGAACLATASLFLWWRWVRRPSAGRLATLTIALGVAIAAKTSNLAVLAVACVFTLVRTYQRRWPWTRLVTTCSVMVGGAFLILWALYRFELRPIPELFGSIPVPAASYWEAIRWLREQMALGRPAFLFGHYTTWGWWYYFPVVFLIKTPLPVLILLVLALFLHLSGRLTRRIDVDYALYVYPLLYLGAAAFSTLNLGYRHLLPVVPLVTIYVARVALWPGWKSRWSRYVLVCLLAWLLVSAGMIFPYHLAYFNELAGGPSNGYRCLVDSNLDWGQDLKTLKRFLDEQGIDEPWLGYFGTGSPDYYGIRYRSIFVPGSPNFAEGFAPLNPAPGWYAISATVLQGPFSSEPDALDWFRRRKPDAMIGYSILVYRVDSDLTPPGWLGLCFGQSPAMSEEDVLRRLGREDIRVVGFDCGQSWVAPAGHAAGWYLVPPPVGGADSLTSEFLDRADLVFRGRGLRDRPAYALYRTRVPVDIGSMVLDKEMWRSETLAPAGADSLGALDAPVNLNGQIDLLGYRMSPEEPKAGEELVVTTAWKVRSRPGDFTLALFAHLVDPGRAVSVGDSLGYSAIQWLPGDVFVQQNGLKVPAGAAGTYWIEVGIYSLASGDRLQVLEGGRAVADRVLLGPVGTAP